MIGKSDMHPEIERRLPDRLLGSDMVEKAHGPLEGE
jgi:hypothetical protein